MNESVCRLCRRYGGKCPGGFARGWMCARQVFKESSEVIPGFSFWRKDLLHPILPERRDPPEWCERPLEQVILEPDAEMIGRKGEMPGLEHDGNAEAERHAIQRHERGVW